MENLAAARSASELDVAGKVVLPSFVDPLSFVTGLPVHGAALDPDSPAQPRSPAVERQVEESLTRQCRAAPAGKLAFHAARVLQEMVRHGTGTVEIHAGIGLEENPGSKALRATSRLEGGPIDVTHSLLLAQPGLSEFEGLEADYVRWVADLLLPRLARRDPVQAACVCLGFGILDDYSATTIAWLWPDASGCGSASRAAHSPRTPPSNSPSAPAPPRSPASPISLKTPAWRWPNPPPRPSSARSLSYNRWRDPEPAREFIDAGAIVALATGWHPVFSPIASMPMILSLACTLYAMKPAEALTAATVNSAAALGLLDRCGTLEPGKQGDFLVLAVPDFRDLPVLVGVNPVEAVVKRGAVVWQRGEVTWPQGSEPGRLVECVPNFSAGRDARVIAAIARAASAVPGILLLDLQTDADHNRSVLTFAGPPDAVLEAAVASAGVAARLIDMTLHAGVHPRVGAADVVPFVPLRGVTLEECAALAWSAGEQHWRRNGVPVYFYDAAARRPDRTRLEQIRQGGFAFLQTAALADEYRRPDVGGPALHPTAGASIIGARKLLVAYNVNLQTPDVAVARRIARLIRDSSGGLPGVKALGVFLESRGLAQVTTTITDFELAPVHVVFHAISDAATREGVGIAGSQLIGLLPRQALEMAGPTDFRWERWDDSMVLETRLEMAASGQLRIPGLASDLPGLSSE